MSMELDLTLAGIVAGLDDLTARMRAGVAPDAVAELAVLVDRLRTPAPLPVIASTDVAPAASPDLEAKVEELKAEVAELAAEVSPAVVAPAQEHGEGA